MERDSFIFYRSFYESVKEIPKEEQLQTYQLIIEYALNGVEIDAKGIPKAIFALVKPQIDANTKRYENGKKGGRKPKQNQNETKSKPNVNDNVNVNENVNAVIGDSCVDGLQKVIDFFNNNIGAITPYGLETLADYLKDMDYEVIIYAMQKAVEANIKTIQYIKGTLNNWNKAGIKTLIQAQEENEKFKNKPKETTKKAYQNYEQRDIKNFDNFYAN